MTTRRIARLAAALIVLGVTSGCEQPEYIEIDPPSATLKQMNNEVWLRGLAKSRRGTEFRKAVLGWSVKDPSIATVDDKGRLRPLKSGRTEVVASYGDVTASIPVEVVLAEKMKVEPTSLELTEDGDAVDFTVKVYDYQGREIRDRTPTFKSLNDKILRMGQNAAHPIQPGATKVEVRVDELLQTVDVTVKKRK